GGGAAPPAVTRAITSTRGIAADTATPRTLTTGSDRREGSGALAIACLFVPSWIYHGAERRTGGDVGRDVLARRLARSELDDVTQRRFLHQRQVGVALAVLSEVGRVEPRRDEVLVAMDAALVGLVGALLVVHDPRVALRHVARRDVEPDLGVVDVLVLGRLLDDLLRVLLALHLAVDHRGVDRARPPGLDRRGVLRLAVAGVSGDRLVGRRRRAVVDADPRHALDVLAVVGQLQ